MQLPEVLVSFVDWANQKFDFSSYNNSNVVQKLAPFCIPCHLVASFLHGLLLNLLEK